MKILFLSKTFYPAIGGVEKHVLKVSLELIKQGHQVTVLTQKHEPKLSDRQNYRGIKIVRIPQSQSKFTIWKNLWPKQALMEEAEVIHCHDIFFWYLPFRFLYLFKPVYTTFHGWEGQWPIPKKNIFLRKIWEILSTANICIGDYLTKWYQTKANFVIYGGVYKSISDRKLNYIQAAEEECIFIGRLENDLGLTEYFKALKILKSKGYKITFIGDGPMKHECQKIGKVLGKIKDLSGVLKQRPRIFASSYLTIWEALSYGCQVFSLYQNPLKKDYLEKFPAAKYLHISGSAEALLSQINQKLPPCPRFPSWQEVSEVYLKLWQKNSLRSI